jgi:Fe-S-cluster containining protein
LFIGGNLSSAGSAAICQSSIAGNFKEAGDDSHFCSKESNTPEPAQTLLDRRCRRSILKESNGACMIDPKRLPALAERQAEQDFEFRDFLKWHPKLSSKQVDHLVFGISEKVWKAIDCTTCGNCCTVVSPTLKEDEVAQLAYHLGESSSEFASKYLKPAEPGEPSPWVVRQRPCPFLHDKRCTVYEHRPANCRDYPYLDEPNFTSRTLAMIDRLSECPAVFEVWEQLKVATGFRLRRTDS